MIKTLYRTLLCSFCLICCSNTSTDTQENSVISSTIQKDSHTDNYILPYDIGTPSSNHVLDSKLGEISSLAFDNYHNIFICNDDENGKIYILYGSDFSIVEEIKFSEKGDFEAIEKIGPNFYIAKSNGNVYNYNLETKETLVIKSDLSTKNDVEGMCFNENEGVLLLACKGQALEESKKSNGHKSVYKLDLETSKMDTKPFLKIFDEDLIKQVTRNFSSISKSKSKNFKQRAKSFAPSGIAIHPRTGNYYMISAKGSTLVVYSPSKELLHVGFLNENTIPQPEGITFDDSGSLYISTEGKGFSGKIFKFDFQ